MKYVIKVLSSKMKNKFVKIEITKIPNIALVAESKAQTQQMMDHNCHFSDLVHTCSYAGNGS